MDRDGTKAGYDLELLRAIVDAVEIPVIASGGVGNLEHMREGLAEGGVIVRAGSALGEEGRLRVTYGTRAENDRFLAALDELL